jgi:CheY-like chemotaxis protein
MNGILGMAELLGQTPLSDTQRIYVQTLSRSGDALLTILNDILDLSKIESGHLHLERYDFDLREAIEDCLELMSVRAAQKGIELSLHIPADLPTAVRGDGVRVQQVVNNLLGNALKFTERGAVSVVVAREPALGEGGHVVRVKDTGVGIAPERLEELFEPFAQADVSISRRYGGTGLGLAIARQLAQLMGGTVSASSVPGQGAEFAFSLRLGPGQARSRPELASLAGLHVLVVDDSPANLRILDDMLRGCGIATTLAGGAEQALAQLDSQPCGTWFAALIDGQLQDIDGLQLARRLGAHPNVPQHLVVLSSIGQVVDAAGLREAGVARWLVKPVRQRSLLELLLALVGEAGGVSRGGPGAAQPHEPAAAPLAAAAGTRGRVLLAEDNAVNQLFTEAVLRSLGYEVHTVGDGADAVAAATSRAFDIVLMDCQMPQRDGLEATREIRAFECQQGVPDDKRLPVVALTASAMSDERTRCLQAGMDDFLAKPFSADDLRRVLEQWIPPR